MCGRFRPFSAQKLEPDLLHHNAVSYVHFSEQVLRAARRNPPGHAIQKGAMGLSYFSCLHLLPFAVHALVFSFFFFVNGADAVCRCTHLNIHTE